MINQDHPLRVVRLSQNLSIQDVADATGLGWNTIFRAEQGHAIQPTSRRILCDFFQMGPADLGLLPTKEKEVSPSRDDNDMQWKRREFLRLFSVAGALLAFPMEVEEIADWEHIGSALERPSHLDLSVIESLEIVNQQYWSVFRAAPSKYVILDGVLGQLRIVTEFLRTTSNEAIRRQIGKVSSDLSQLAGELFFDANDYEAAQSCYSFAATVARDTHHHDLWACALIRNAFLPLYEQQYAAAFSLVRQARRIAHKGDSSLVTRFWAAAVEADTQAGMQNLAGCQRALDYAQEVQHVKGGANGTWLRFESDRLAEQRGACFVKLGQPELAEPALQTALQQASSIRRRGLVLGDMAIAAVQRQDIEQACHYGNAILAAYQTGASGVLKKSLLRLQEELQPFQQASPVRELNQHIRYLTPQPSER